MRQAETVTFGGSGLDRAGELRTDIPALAKALTDPAARVIPLWRGKVLVTGEDMLSLVRLPMDHPIIEEASDHPIILGREEGDARFAHDISGWEPGGDLSTLGGFVDTSEQRHPSLPDDHRFVELRAAMTRLSPRDAELAASAKAIQHWHRGHPFCARCGHATEIHQGGWQRICPSCGAHHFPRTDPVVIMLITHSNSVLLGRSPGWPEGMYSCLAGFVEPGETVEAAVRREVFEEAGVAVGAVRYLASQPWPFPASLMFGCQGDALGTDITIDPAEIEDAQWVSKEDVALAFTGGHPWLKPARKGAIAHFLLRNWLADTLD